MWARYSLELCGDSAFFSEDHAGAGQPRKRCRVIRELRSATAGKGCSIVSTRRGRRPDGQLILFERAER
jgi:hypothetical protein